MPEDGLAAYGDDGDDLMLALARKIVAGEEDADSVESVFAQAQQVAADAEALLRHRVGRARAGGGGSRRSRGRQGRPARRRWRAAAVAVLVGGVHGRRRGQASAPPGRGSNALTVQVGAGEGAGGRARRSGPLGGRGGIADRGGVPRPGHVCGLSSCPKHYRLPTRVRRSHSRRPARAGPLTLLAHCCRRRAQGTRQRAPRCPARRCTGGSRSPR